MTAFWQAAFTLLMFLLVGAGVLAVCAAMSRPDDRLEDWDDADDPTLPYGGGWGA